MTDDFADAIEFSTEARPLPRPTFAEARDGRDAGMARAAKAAENASSGWGEQAFQWIAAYAKTHKTFISEDCTADAADSGLTAPSDPRAWGAPFKRAAHQNIIKRVGFGISKRRHLSPTPLWESLVI